MSPSTLAAFVYMQQTCKGQRQLQTKGGGQELTVLIEAGFGVLVSFDAILQQSVNKNLLLLLNKRFAWGGASASHIKLDLFSKQLSNL